MEVFTAPGLLLTVFGVFMAGAIGSLLLSRHNKAANYWSGVMAMIGSVGGMAVAASVLLTGKTIGIALTSSSLPLMTYAVRVDSLSAFFMFTVSLVVFFCSLYGLGYVKQYYGQYNVGYLGFLYCVFILSLLLVVTAANGIFFLIVWEIMSLASYFLVVYERKVKENVKAGLLYLVMTHIGTGLILLAFLLLYAYGGSFDFAALSATAGDMPDYIKSAVFLLGLVGFGIKAGVIPFHIWLPSAHPAAPSHVSAIMSGVMIKTGIYMMIRLFIDLLQPVPAWWGIVVLILGAASCVLGVLYALTEHDIKRLLAYHSIENIGIILLGLGSALIFSAYNYPVASALALTAALFHTFNHAIFKSLLFLGAGSVIHATGTRDMERYGGLMKLMPLTGLFFLIGSMAISALPPFNGFFSEWLTFQALFQGMTLSGPYVAWVFIGVVAALALTSGLAVACFVKVFGITFLARPRSAKAESAHEVGRLMQAGMAALAAACLIVGVSASWIIAQLQTIGNSLAGVEATWPILRVSENQTLSINSDFAIISPILIAGLVISVPVIVWLFSKYGVNRNQKVTTNRTWDCGTELTGRMEITSTGFARSIISVFRGLLKPSLQHSVGYVDATSRYTPNARTVTLKVEDVYRIYIYLPALRAVTFASTKVKNLIQNGNINAYILYVLVALIILLGVRS